MPSPASTQRRHQEPSSVDRRPSVLGPRNTPLLSPTPSALLLHHHLHDMRHHCKENKPQTEFAAASSRPPTPSSRRDSSRYGDFPPPVSPQASSPPLPLSFSHLTMISRALKLQQRKAPGAPRSTARHGYVPCAFCSKLFEISNFISINSCVLSFPPITPCIYSIPAHNFKFIFYS